MPHKAPPKPKSKSKLKEAKTLTAKQTKYNGKISHLRARIEIVFAFMKTRVPSLSSPFPESVSELHNVVMFAIGLNNRYKQIIMH